MTRQPGKPAARSLRAAHKSAYVEKKEDQLTEVLAWALQNSPGLCRALMKHERIECVLPAGQLKFSAVTQRPVPHFKRTTDLELIASTKTEPVARLWCENKFVSKESKGQLNDQFEGLRAIGQKPRGKLAAIVQEDRDRARIERTPDRPRGIKAAVAILTWQEIADVVSKTGRRNGGGRWRDHAKEDAATHQQRVLDSYLGYLARYAVSGFEPGPPVR